MGDKIKIDDVVKCIEADGGESAGLKKGHYYRVIEVAESLDGWTQFINISGGDVDKKQLFKGSRFEVCKKKKPNKFKTGDSVKYIDTCQFFGLTIGKEYRVSGIHGSMVNILLDDGTECLIKDKRFVKVISKPKYGDKVLVSDKEDGDYEEQYFIAHVEGSDYPYGVNTEKPRQDKQSQTIYMYKYMKNIEGETNEYTMDEIADKLGIPVEQLKIKK